MELGSGDGRRWSFHSLGWAGRLVSVNRYALQAGPLSCVQVFGLRGVVQYGDACACSVEAAQSLRGGFGLVVCFRSLAWFFARCAPLGGGILSFLSLSLLVPSGFRVGGFEQF